MSLAASHPLVVSLEAELLPHCRSALQELSQVAPSAKASIFALPVGAATSYQGYHFGISCLLSGVAASETDEVALVISLCHLDRVPRLNAEIVWGSGKIEADLAGSAGSSEDWPFATSERVAEVRSQLPRLVEALCFAVQRATP